MSQAKSKHVIETIAPVDLWGTIADNVNQIASRKEAAFEFGKDGLRIRVKDAANVAMIDEQVDVAGFEHYDVAEPTTIGINTEKFADLLGVGDTEAVKFHLNAETRKFEFEASGVEYDLSGIAPDSMKGTPVEVPGLKDEYDWVIDVDLPVEKWSKACDVIDLAGSGHGTFAYRPSDDAFVLEGHGDDDTSRVDLTDHDAFDWRDGKPDVEVECIMSNEYMPKLVDVLEAGDDDVVRFVTGNELPLHVWTSHEGGVIDTKVMQAPRITSN